MPNSRGINTCVRCRSLKVKCDRHKPACGRCAIARVDCSLSEAMDDGLGPSDAHDDRRTSYSTAGHSSGADTSTTSPNSEAEKIVLAQDISRRNKQSANPTKRRHRACLSCMRCHRLKVKCDKAHPCGRCRSSGFARQCQYTHRVEGDDSGLGVSHNFIVSETTTGAVVSAWKLHPRGSSHWRELMSKVENLARLTSPLFFFAAEEMSHDGFECAVDLCLPTNYPFNSAGASKYLPLENTRNLLLRHHPDWQLFLDHYCNVFHSVHPIINTAEIQSMIAMTADDLNVVDVALLGQFSMILGLGAFASLKAADLATDFFMAAEACLSKTPYMIRPSIAVLRTMCLMFVAKQMANATCWSVDGCWTLMGFICRQAVNMGLHRAPGPFYAAGSGTFEQWRDGQILWTTIMFFNISVSTVAGMPSLIRAEEVLHEAEDWAFDGLDSTEQVWHTVVRKSCPLLLEIVARINSDQNVMKYDEALEYNSRLRHFMSLLEGYKMGPTLRIVLDLYFRRLLLVLHRRFALDSDGPLQYSVSYWASLECSLATLVHHRELCEGDSLSSGSDMIVRFFMLDFFTAAMTACIHLLRHDAPFVVVTSIPPQETIFNTLEICIELWSKEQERSVCFKAGYKMLQSVVRLISDKIEQRTS